MTNPFQALGNTQFTPAAPAPEAQAPFGGQAAVAPAPAPQAASVPQFGQAAPAPAPQFGQAAPAPAQQAAPVAPPQAVDPNAPNPAEVGTAAFGTSRGQGEGHKLKDDLGQPLLIRIHRIRNWTNQQGQVVESADVDWVVLDPANPQLRANGSISNGPVVRDLKETLQSGRAYHVGRVKEVPSKYPQPALALGPLSDEEQQFAIQAGQALGWF